MPKGRKPTKTPETGDASRALLEKFQQELRHQTAILLEDMRSQNKLTAESVSVKVDALAQELRDGLRESRERDALLEAAIRSLRTDLGRVETKVDHVETTLKAEISRVETKVDHVETTLKAEISRVETKVDRIETRLTVVEAKVDKLVPLEERVAALERRRA